jgi:hypothetical protein
MALNETLARNEDRPSNNTGAEFLHSGEAPRKDGNLFGWTVFILLLIRFLRGCSVFVFGHPKAVPLFDSRKGESWNPQAVQITFAPEGEFQRASALEV